MKKTVLLILTIVIGVTSAFSSCSKKNENIYTNRPYAKTPTDGAKEVIEIEFDKNTYKGNGDLNVYATVGFGRLPEVTGDENERLYVEYLVIKAPWSEKKRPSWEMETSYQVSWYDEMFNAGVDENGEIYPLFSESVDIIFPAGVSEGYFEVRLYKLKDGNDKKKISSLYIYFERENGVLMINP